MASDRNNMKKDIIELLATEEGKDITKLYENGFITLTQALKDLADANAMRVIKEMSVGNN